MDKFILLCKICFLKKTKFLCPLWSSAVHTEYYKICNVTGEDKLFQTSNNSCFSLLGFPPATSYFPWRGKNLLNIWHTALAEALLVLSGAEGLLHAFYKLQFCVNILVLTFNIFTTARSCWLMLRLWFTPCRAAARCWIPTLPPALCRSSPRVEGWHIAHF